jgi:hypothetical protein
VLSKYTKKIPAQSFFMELVELLGSQPLARDFKTFGHNIP